MFTDEILKYCKIAACVSIFLFFISISVFTWSILKLPKQIYITSTQSTETLTEIKQETLQVKDILTELDTTLQEVNRPCGKNSSCGTIANLNKTLNTTRLTMGQIEIAANHEDKNLSKLDNQEEIIFNDTHHTLNSLTNTLTTLNDSSKEIKPLLMSTTNTMNEFHTTIGKVNSDLDDPRLNNLIDHIDGISTHVDNISSNVDYKVNKFVHPNKVKLTFWTGTESTLLWIHTHIIPPLF